MNNLFTSAQINHISAKNIKPGLAARTILTEDDFSAAVGEISAWEGYAKTPLNKLDELADSLGLASIFYKDEGPRFGLESFKALGGAYAGLKVLQRELSKRLRRPIALSEIREGILATDVAEITLISATDGNHGRSLAWGSSTFGAPCRIYIHKEVSEGREKSIRDLGAEVIRIDGDYDESVRVTRQEADKNGWFIVSDTSWEGYTQTPTDVMAGYGVMVDEITEQMPHEPTHLFIQGGVGGLAAAVTAGLRQYYGNNTRIVVVEPELAACLFESGKTGIATTVPIAAETLMAGLSCGEPSALAWEILKNEVQDFLTIPEVLVAPSMQLLARPTGNDPAITAGESAVCGLAGLIAACSDPQLKADLGLSDQSRVLLIGSEGATDPEIYHQLVDG